MCTIRDVKNTVHYLLPKMCRDVDAPMIAIYRAKYVEGCDGEEAVEKIGPPLKPWVSVHGIIEETFSDEAVGWKERGKQKAKQNGTQKKKKKKKAKEDDPLMIPVDSSDWDEDLAAVVSTVSTKIHASIEMRKRKRMWDRVKEKVVFVAEIPEAIDDHRERAEEVSGQSSKIGKKKKKKKSDVWW